MAGRARGRTVMCVTVGATFVRFNVRHWRREGGKGRKGGGGRERRKEGSLVWAQTLINNSIGGGEKQRVWHR